jgi:hypothetical protein
MSVFHSNLFTLTLLKSVLLATNRAVAQYPQFPPERTHAFS